MITKILKSAVDSLWHKRADKLAKKLGRSHLPISQRAFDENDETDQDVINWVFGREV
jgi:hypothetical protein